MILVSTFRGMPHHVGPPVRAIPTSVAPVANAPQSKRSAGPHCRSKEAPALNCRWEVGEEQYVQLGGQTFHVGQMLMHWMPVH
jgi:hypothetical protein